ncbi:MAG: hypothetical protein JSS57_19655 [Proteobacteria bacterium]|nr:hypothetical protein [Pseudomonadota bacterium]
MNDTLIISGTTLVPEVNVAQHTAAGVCVDEVLELRAVEAESIGWWPLGEDAYFHPVDRSGVGVTVISVVGLPEDAQEGVPTLLLV